MPSLRSLNKKIASYLFSTLTLILALVGAAQPQASASSVTINLTTPPTLSGTPGGTITYTTNWSGGPTSTSWEIFTHFVDSSGNIVFQDPAHYPNPLTTSWTRGAYTETRTIRIPSTLSAGTYYVMAGMFNGGNRLTLNPGPGVTEDNQTRYKIATLTVGSAPTINPAAPSTLSGTPGGTITYTTNWSGGPTSTSLEIFTQFVDSSGNIVSQDPAHYPNPLTTSWTGGAYTETRTIRIPSTLSAGTYYVMAGMFNGGTRLTLNPGPGVTEDNKTRYKIATLTVDSDLTIVFTPLNPIIACTAAAGTLVSAVSVTGGDGNAITLAMSGDTTDFALSGSNIVVAAGGITSSACGTFQTVIVAASQP